MKTSAMINHKTQIVMMKTFSFVLVFALTLLAACNSDDNNFATDKEDNETAEFDASEDYYQEDSEDLAIDVLTSHELEEGKAASDSRLDCAVITRTGSKSAGTITIDFGTGCTDPRGNVRKGAIVIEYEGRWTLPGSFWRLRFVNHSINDVTIEGIRTITNISASEDSTQTFSIVLEDGTMTWPDGSIARRSVHRTRELERDQNNVLNRLIIYGTAEGNHRNGRGYYIEILERLIYDRACAAEGVFIPVSGKKLIKHGLREITVDYGNGECDNVVTITNKNGRSWQHTVTHR